MGESLFTSSNSKTKLSLTQDDVIHYNGTVFQSKNAFAASSFVEHLQGKEGRDKRKTRFLYKKSFVAFRLESPLWTVKSHPRMRSRSTARSESLLWPVTPETCFEFRNRSPRIRKSWWQKFCFVTILQVVVKKFTSSKWLIVEVGIAIETTRFVRFHLI